MDKLIGTMSIEQKIGQLIVVGFSGTKLNGAIAASISQRFAGGVALFGRNIESPQQVARLTNQLQEVACATEHRIPLFIATDQEGGCVSRLKKGATVFPGNMALGATRSGKLAKLAGKIMGSELSAVGINLNFAPVMDVNNNPCNPVINRRSFGDSPELVSELGIAYIAGLQENGVLATAKHFPGHGDTTVDSHAGLPTMTHDVERMYSIELKPFRAAIKAGVGAIMTAHIVYPLLDVTRPATLAPTILTGLLRGELGFDSLIITDDMGMKAIDEHYNPGEAAVMAVDAGADIILALWTLESQTETYNALVSAVKRGRISEERIDQSVGRILRGKTACGLWEPCPSDSSEAIRMVGKNRHRQVAQTIAARAITMVHNRSRVLPLKMDASALIVSSSNLLFNLFRVRHYKSKNARIGHEPNLEQILSQLFIEAKTVEVVIAGIVNQAQVELIVQLSSRIRTPVVVIALGSPYLLNRSEHVAAAVATYDEHHASVLAAVKVILGEASATGKMPIRLHSSVNELTNVESL